MWARRGHRKIRELTSETSDSPVHCTSLHILTFLTTLPTPTLCTDAAIYVVTVLRTSGFFRQGGYRNIRRAKKCQTSTSPSMIWVGCLLTDPERLLHCSTMRTHLMSPYTRTDMQRRSGCGDMSRTCELSRRAHISCGPSAVINQMMPFHVDSHLLPLFLSGSSWAQAIFTRNVDEEAPRGVGCTVLSMTKKRLPWSWFCLCAPSIMRRRSLGSLDSSELRGGVLNMT